MRWRGTRVLASMLVVAVMIVTVLSVAVPVNGDAQPTGEETQITTNTAFQYNPAIYGDRVVWQDGRNGNGDINIYDLSTGTEIINQVPDVEPYDLSECGLLRYVDGSIVDTYDLINDSANYTVLFTPYMESSGWLSNGAGSITKVNDTWYIVHRLRTGDTDRGHYLLLNSSTDLTTWPSVWNVSTDDVAPANPASFERVALKYYNDSYYLYFCVDTGGGSWQTLYIKCDTAAGLEFGVKNSNNWTLIVSGGKDPEVLHHKGTYYCIVSDGMYKACLLYTSPSPRD